MTRPSIHDGIRLAMVAVGVCCLILAVLAVWEFRRYKTADGVVEVYPVIEYGRTNMQTEVAYTRDDGTRTVVMSSEIPASARAGEHLTVFYDPRRIKDSWLLGNEWTVLAGFALAGVALTALGLFARSRRRVVFAESHENAA